MRRTYWLTSMLAIVSLSPALAGDTASADNTTEFRMVAGIRILDQYGRQISSGKPDGGGQIFDVTVGPSGNELTFDPDTVNIASATRCAGLGRRILTVSPVAPPAKSMDNFVRLITRTVTSESSTTQALYMSSLSHSLAPSSISATYTALPE